MDSARTNLRRSIKALALVLALGVSIGAEAQNGKVYRIGMLSPASPLPGLLENFREGLQELGYVQGRNVAIEWRDSGGRNEQLAALADELVRLRVDVILAVNTPAALAAKRATTTIPIVITRVADPVKSGLVASLSRPGGNITGLSFIPDVLGPKQLQFVKEIVRSLSSVAILFSADNPGATIVVNQMDLAAPPSGLRVLRLPVRGPGDFPSAFHAATAGRAGALVVVDDVLLTKHRVEILALATKHSLPVVSLYAEFAEAGGLFAYGASPPAIYRRAAYYVDRILKGANPGDLPVEQPTKFDLIVNLKTARTLGLTIPWSLLLIADRIIE